jgi:Flp pilus assembly protein TadG
MHQFSHFEKNAENLRTDHKTMKLNFLRGKLGSCLGGFLRSAAGGVAVQFAMVSPVLLGASGLAIDYGTHSLKVIELQSIADTAALGGAGELAISGSSDSAINSVVTSYISAKYEGSGSKIASKTVIDRKAATLRVVLEETWAPVFAAFLNADVTPIRVDATASLVGGDNICVLALDGSNPLAIHMDKYAKLKANGCGVYSNSTSTQAIRLDMNSSMMASSICSAGGYMARTTAVNPVPTTDCPPADDPLAKRPEPSIGSCDKTNFAISSGTKILDPGVYCGGIKISKTASVVFNPGTYIIQDGDFVVSDTAKVEGEHVGFYLAGDKSPINFTGDAAVKLTGALDGELAGLLFFEDRSADLDRKHHIQSTKAAVLTGTIYLSRGKLLIDPNSPVAGNSAYTAIIAHKLELNEGPELILNSDYDATSVPVPEGIRSNAQIVLTE